MTYKFSKNMAIHIMDASRNFDLNQKLGMTLHDNYEKSVTKTFRCSCL